MAELARGVFGAINVAITEVEVVGFAIVIVGSRGPVKTGLASATEQPVANIDRPAPHKEEGTKGNIIRIAIHWTSTR